jgi:hypothetical protein
MNSVMLLIWLMSLAPEGNLCTSVVPLSTGWVWSYRGSAVWSGSKGSPDSGTVSWAMTIVAARYVGVVRLALVRGLVTQLAWYEPRARPRLSLLACRGSQLFGLELASDSAAASAYAHWSDSLFRRAQLLLDLPLHDGQLFGQDPPRDDPFYAWAVTALRPEAVEPVPVSCGASMEPRFGLTYRSLPDQAVIEWQPGVGITGYSYVHHGIPAAADVRLIACRRVRP